MWRAPAARRASWLMRATVASVAYTVVESESQCAARHATRLMGRVVRGQNVVRGVGSVLSMASLDYWRVGLISNDGRRAAAVATYGDVTSWRPF